ncbi:MAG: LysM peptidoglycan-binding domain-containing protein, partial [Muribaculaceae bacterium]|nr:LysM peptidoglycan-binding domain-containing protein [Muribaculaceae bacterium]
RLYIPCAIVDKGHPRALESNTGAVVATQPVVSVPAARNDSNVPDNTTYTVKRGESLYGISHKHGMTTDQLIALNPSAEYGVKGVTYS